MAVWIISSTDQQGDSAGVALSGCKIYVYDVGTTTLKSLFSDTALTVPAANPIICDSAGRHDMRYIATIAYKIVVKTSADVTVFTRDNIDPGVPIGSGILAIANGGTGASSAAAALTNLGGATAAELAVIAADVAALSGTLGSSEKTHIATGTTVQRPAVPAEGDIRRNLTTSRWEGYVVATWQNFLVGDIATQTDMETATSNVAMVTPVRVKNDPGVAKAWGFVTVSGGTPTLTVGHNVASITDVGAGNFTINFTTVFSSANYAVICQIHHATPGSDRIFEIIVTARAAGNFTMLTLVEDVAAGGTADPQDNISFYFACFGDQ